MKILVTRRTVITAAVVLSTIVAIGWAAVLRNSIAYAVPAGAQHLNTLVPSPPDDVPEDPSTNNAVSVPFMTRGYCYAGSPLKDTKAPGGFGQSANAPKKVQAVSTSNALSLLAQPGVAMTYKGDKGMRVILINNTQDLLAFSASDSRLAVTQEAQDPDGNWRPVEYLPSSGCGNSYHRVFLRPQQYWAFSAPRYKGTMSTKLRFAMPLADFSQLYSNVFIGSVNPEQFTLKEGHSATNLMDPYSE